jgi:uncharacterized protein (TIGR02266 family)
MQPSLDPTSTREHSRYEVNIKVDCQTRNMFTAHRVTNISSGGLFIAAEQPLPLYSEVLLRLTLDSSTIIEARGKVIWNYDVRKDASAIVPGSGIKFLDLRPEHRARLEAYLKSVADTEPSARRSRYLQN